MDTTTIIIIALVLVLVLCCSSSMYFMSYSDSTPTESKEDSPVKNDLSTSPAPPTPPVPPAPPAPKTCTADGTWSINTPVTPGTNITRACSSGGNQIAICKEDGSWDVRGCPVPDCPNVGWGVGKPGVTIIERECSLGPSYTGKLIKKCTAQGVWIDDNQCVSSGNADLIDISGDWQMMYGGNMGTAKITAIDNNNWNVTTSGNDTPGQQLPRGTTKIKYVANEGYYYHGNQAAKFTNPSHTKLDGGNYYFSKQ